MICRIVNESVQKNVDICIEFEAYIIRFRLISFGKQLYIFRFVMYVYSLTLNSSVFTLFWNSINFILPCWIPCKYVFLMICLASDTSSKLLAHIMLFLRHHGMYRIFAITVALKLVKLPPGDRHLYMQAFVLHNKLCNLTTTVSHQVRSRSAV